MLIFTKTKTNQIILFAIKHHLRIRRIYSSHSIRWTAGPARHYFTTDGHTKHFTYLDDKRKTILDALITCYKVENQYAVSSNTERRNKHKGGHVSFLCWHQRRQAARKHLQMFHLNFTLINGDEIGQCSQQRDWDKMCIRSSIHGILQRDGQHELFTFVALKWKSRTTDQVNLTL